MVKIQINKIGKIKIPRHWPNKIISCSNLYKLDKNDSWV